MDEEEGIQDERPDEDEGPEEPQGDEAPPEDEAGLDDDGEPGGDDPQAVRARKEYRRRKKTEEAARALENQVLTLQGQVEALRQQAAPSGGRGGNTLDQMTADQVRNWAVENGHEFDPAVQQVIREKERKELKQELLVEAERHFEQKERSKTANEQLMEYQVAYPGLARPGSQELMQVAQELNHLMGQGLQNNEVTQLMAVKMVFGPIKRQRDRKQTDSYSRRHRDVSSETNGGSGGTTEQSSGRGGLKNPDGVPVDRETIQHWREMGHSEEHMKELAKHYAPPRRVTMRM